MAVAAARSTLSLREQQGRTEAEFWAYQNTVLSKVFASKDAIEGATAFAEKDGAKMKETDADREVRDRAYSVTANELRRFIERWERLEAERSDLAQDQKEVMAEAKGRGYDVKTIRKVIALRKRSPEAVAEEEAILDIYKSALGM